MEIVHPTQREGMRGHPTDLLIADTVLKLSARRLCDLGCGNGRDALQLIRTGLADFVFGIDNGSEPHNSRIHMVKLLIPPDVKNRLMLVEGDYENAVAIAHDIAGDTDGGPLDLCYTNNVLEHVDDPDDIIRVSLEVAPKALHIVPCERHGWCDDHQHAWTEAEFVDMLDKHGTIEDLGLLKDPPPFPCYEKGCRHLIMFALVSTG